MKALKKVALVITILVTFLIIFINIPEKKSQLKSPHFNISYSTGIDKAEIKRLADTLERNYDQISVHLNTIPAGNIHTNVYAQRWRYIIATGNIGASGNISGYDKLHFIHLPASERENQTVAAHEFTHTVVLKLLADQEKQPLTPAFDKKFKTFPVWLWEAISTYEANQFVDPKNLNYLQNGEYPTLAELSNRSNGGKIYACGYTVIEYILSRYGKTKFIMLIRNYGNTKKVLGISEKEFAKNWYRFINEKYMVR